MTPLFLLLLLILLAPVTAQAGVAEQSLTHANAKVRAAVLHDVCEVHGNEKRDQLDAEDRADYASILKELQRSLDTNDDPEVATQTFCEFGRRLQKPAAEPHKPLADYSRARLFIPATATAAISPTMPTRTPVRGVSAWGLDQSKFGRSGLGTA